MNEPRPRITSARPFESASRRGEPLEDAHGIVRAQHRDGRAEVDAARLPGDRGEHHVRRRDREVVAVVLADAEEVEPDPIGQDALGDDVADDLRLRKQDAPRRRRVTSPKVCRPSSRVVALTCERSLVGDPR